MLDTTCQRWPSDDGDLTQGNEQAAEVCLVKQKTRRRLEHVMETIDLGGSSSSKRLDHG